MKNYLKIIACSLAIIMLCACARQGNTNKNTTMQSTTDNTLSNTVPSENETTIGQNDYNQTTTEAKVDPVASFQNYARDKVVWGSGTVTDHQQPNDPKLLQQEFSKLGGSWLIDGDKTICLTFDEGYENGYTPSILDTLKEKKIKAIFFVTYDFASQNKELVQRMIDEGHIVGNHSWHHYSMDELDDEKAKEEVQYLHDYIKENFNYTMSYFRFPKGEFSQQSLATVSSLGYKSVFWSFAYVDWDVDNQPNPDDAMQSICEATHNGEILLLHAVGKTNAEILPRVIDDIKKQGYTFTTNI